MDIGSGHGYPASSLSNFAPHPFEGLLQAFKHSDPEVQRSICLLVGMAAKRRGKDHWKTRQILFWRGVPYPRKSAEYQTLLDRAFEALSANEGFRRALLASGEAVLAHSLGKTDPTDTVLTRAEFCRRLTALRDRLTDPALGRIPPGGG